MADREAMLARIRAALGPRRTSPDRVEVRDALPPGGRDYGERLQIFARHAEALRAQFEVLRTPEEAGARLRPEAPGGIAAHRHPLTESALAGLPVLWVEDRPDVSRLEACAVGVTACEALVAQTGSVLVSARTCGGRGLSVLPPHHVVLARPEQLMPDLTAALEHVLQHSGGDLPSSLSFITGPSRTGDIERILVLGAHGPARLTILLVGPPPGS